MKIYKSLILMVLLAIAGASAYATPTSIDPTPILRGGGGSTPVVFTFTGAFATPAAANAGLDYLNISGQTFTGITLDFTTVTGGPLSYLCDNTVDPFFEHCQEDPTDNNKTIFFGIGPGHPGIPNLTDFNIALFDFPSGASVTFNGTANGAFSATPEPASALLFLSGLGIIARFLKRRSNTVTT
jgi:PEP-CTERM motif